jgi:predicted transposase YdaD
MGLSMKDTFLAKYYLKEGEKKGRMKGKIEGKAEGEIEIVFRLFDKGHSAEEEADITGLQIEGIIRKKGRK